MMYICKHVSYKTKSMHVFIDQRFGSGQKPQTDYCVQYPNGYVKIHYVDYYQDLDKMDSKICERIWELTGGETIDYFNNELAFDDTHVLH